MTGQADHHRCRGCAAIRLPPPGLLPQGGRRLPGPPRDARSERDDRPSVVAPWQGFVDLAGGPRMWDEDRWPVRLPCNPVAKALCSVVFGKGDA